jgi:epoxyqueuosine reductase
MTEMSTHLDSHQLVAEVKRRARKLGFDLVGIAPASPSEFRDCYRQWLDDGQHGTMEYLNRRFEERTDPGVYLPGAKSVICVAMNYHAQVTQTDTNAGRIAQYALGDDYHDLIKPRMHELADFLRQLAPEAQTRACVDTAPVMEKELAARAGVGWLGKNTCIINPRDRIVALSR